MKTKKRITFLIGSFSVGAVVLLTFLLYFLGSTTFFNKGDRYILYFNESVNGLNIGSPVKWRGVPVGSVAEILVDSRLNPDDHLIPVIVEIQSDRLRGVDGNILKLNDPNVMKQNIEQGLRGKLQQLSFITGQIYIELDYSARLRGHAPRMRHYGSMNIVEIPTVPSTLAQISEVLTEVRDSLDEVDFKGIGDQITALLHNLNTNLEGDRIGKAFGGAADLFSNLNEIVQKQEFQEMLKDLEQVMKSLSSISGKVDTEIGPLSKDVQNLAKKVGEVLVKLEGVLGDVEQMVQPESEVRLGVSSMLDTVTQAAASLNRLLDYLERNPDALVKGRTD
jgi:paraquat-inducible protein B